MSEPELWTRCPDLSHADPFVARLRCPDCHRWFKRGLVRVPFDEAIERMVDLEWNEVKGFAPWCGYNAEGEAWWREQTRPRAASRLRAALREDTQ